jgi:2'-5' RNA ligase
VAGTGGSCEQSAVLVPVPEVEQLLSAWRSALDPLAKAGVPAHVTLVVPWLPPEQMKLEHLEELDDLLAGQRVFDYTLERLCWFGERVLWLAPTPAEPFKQMTAMLADHFDTPPWQGEFAEVVPHLTVGHAGVCEDLSLADAEADLASRLPIACRAAEVLVMCGDGFRWSVVHRVALKD